MSCILRRCNMRTCIFVLASFLLIACQPTTPNNPENIPNDSIKLEMDTKITNDNQEVGDNSEMIPSVEKNDYIENDFDVMTGLLNKKGKCLYVDNHLILIQIEHLSFNEDISALYDKDNQVSFKIGDTVTLAGFASDYSDLMDNDMGSNTEWENPYLYDCQSDKVWITVDVVY